MRRTSLCVRVRSEVLERMRDAVWYTRARGIGVFVEEAIEAKIAACEAEVGEIPVRPEGR